MGLGTLLIRADANPEIGTGHVMRCLALGQAWQDAGGNVIFVVASCPPPLRTRLLSERCEVRAIPALPGSAEDSCATIDVAESLNPAWVAIDGYVFSSEYRRRIKESGFNVLCIDDLGGRDEYFANIILNQNVTAMESWYQKRDSVKLLIGPRFCLLRREFKEYSDRKPVSSNSGRNLLVILGGSTPISLGQAVLESLAQVEPQIERAVFVVGSSTSGIQILQGAAKGLAKVELRVDPSDLPALVASSDIAISAAGSTCWELCFFGVPMLLIDVAENQRPLAAELQTRSCARHIGTAASISPEIITKEVRSLLNSNDSRMALSKRAQELVDGYGANRVVAAMGGSMNEVSRPGMHEVSA